MRKAVYLNCWYLNEHESEAMWRLCCPDGYGIAVQTTVHHLEQALDNPPSVKVGKVRYIDY